ncbi:hypothetical protein EMIT0215P_70203 [Pseudomonas serboccidentalis]
MLRMRWQSPFVMRTPVPVCCRMVWVPHAVVAGACVSDSISNQFSGIRILCLGRRPESVFRFVASPRLVNAQGSET